MTGAGSLRERVTIERLDIAGDGAGGQIETWTPRVSVWAEVKPVRGREIVSGERIVGAETYLVTMRYRSDIALSDRVVWRGRALNINSVQDRDMRRKYLVIEAEYGGI